jgi:hypothetical protein
LLRVLLPGLWLPLVDGDAALGLFLLCGGLSLFVCEGLFLYQGLFLFICGGFIGIFLGFRLFVFAFFFFPSFFLFIFAFLLHSVVTLLNNKRNQFQEEHFQMGGQGLRVIRVHINNGGQITINMILRGVIGDFFFKLVEEDLVDSVREFERVDELVHEVGDTLVF